jgi:hypothetical protein
VTDCEHHETLIGYQPVVSIIAEVRTRRRRLGTAVRRLLTKRSSAA